MKKILTYLILSIFTFLFIWMLSINIVYAENTTQDGSNTTSNSTDITNFLPKKYTDLVLPPDMNEYHVRNPGNLPFVHDEKYAKMDINAKDYGTIKNETGYFAFEKAIEFGIKSLIKLVGAMCLYGIFRGLVRLVLGHGEEEQYTKGTQSILWSFVGLILALIAHAVVTALLQSLTGVGTLNI